MNFMSGWYKGLAVFFQVIGTIAFSYGSYRALTAKEPTIASQVPLAVVFISCFGMSFLIPRLFLGEWVQGEFIKQSLSVLEALGIRGVHILVFSGFVIAAALAAYSDPPLLDRLLKYFATYFLGVHGERAHVRRARARTGS